MADIRLHLFNFYLSQAKKGYKEDAELALKYGCDYIESSNDIPLDVKKYFSKEFKKLKTPADRPYAFFLKKKGKGPRPQKAIRDRNIEIAVQVYHHKHYYADGNLREEPLADEIAIEEFASGYKELSESTIGDAYYEYKQGLVSSN